VKKNLRNDQLHGDEKSTRQIEVIDREAHRIAYKKKAKELYEKSEYAQAYYLYKKAWDLKNDDITCIARMSKIKSMCIELGKEDERAALKSMDLA
jgi:hypothetical protein